MLRLLFAVILLGSTLTTYTQPTAIQVQEAHGTSTAALTITFSQAPTVSDLILCTAAHTAGSGATFTWPAGYTTLDTQKNVGSVLGGAMAYRVVQAGDPSSYSLGTSTTVGALSFGCVEYAYVNTTQPIMGEACFTDVSPTTTESTPAQTPSAPTIGASFFAAVGNVTTSPGAQTFTNYDVNVGTGALQVHSQHGSVISAFQSAYNASLGYSAAPAAALGCTVLLNPTITPFTVSAVMSVATPTPSPTPTPTPTPSPTPTPTPGAVYPYAPWMSNVGNASGGGGGWDCGGTPPSVTLCITGAMAKNLNARYIEGGFTGGTPSLNGSSLANDGANMHWVAYQTIENQTKENGFGGVCTGLDKDASSTNTYSGSGTDPGYIHTTTPTSSSNRFVIGTGTCSSIHEPGQTYSGNLYMNPLDASGTNGLINLIGANWFNAGSNPTYGPNGDANVYTIWDNMASPAQSPEMGTSSALTASANFVTAYAKLFANFHYPQIFNAVGSEGGFNDGGVHHGYSYAGAFNCDTTHFECNDPVDFCANDVGSYFKGVQSERALVYGKYSSSTMWMQDIADLIDTYTAYSTLPNCAGTVDLIMLNPPNDSSNPSSATFEKINRMQQLAARILLTPESYTGARNDTGPVMERYLDCYSGTTYVGGSNCINQVPVFPEDGLQFIPMDTGQTRYTGGGNGTGCSTSGTNASASGGAATFTVACSSHKDDAGYYGAIFARAGTCYLYGVSKGTCVLLASIAGGTSTGLNEPIQDAWCKVDGLTQGCSAYPKYWNPIGRGSQTCYKDLGSSLGTPGASCNTGQQVCPPANGCQSAAAESAWPATLTGVSVSNALGDTPGPLDAGGTSTSPTLFTQQNSVLLMSQ